MSFNDRLGFNEVADFLNGRLEDFSNEGVSRTIISRLYYSAFHSIREKIYGTSRRSVNHLDLQNKAGIVAKSKGREKYITHYLSEFETMRAKADYDVGTTMGKKEVSDAYDVFELIEAEFRQIWG